VEQKVTKIAETEEQQANNISEPEIDSDSSYKTKDVHTRKRMIKSVLETKIEQHCSPLEFMDLIENDGFLDTHHYIIDSKFMMHRIWDKISLPKYLTVKGSFNLNGQINLHKLPDILIIKETYPIRGQEASTVDFSNCTGLVHTNNTEIIVEENKGDVSFAGCNNMKHTPIAIYLNNGRLILKDCSSITRFPKYVDFCSLFVVDGCNKFDITDYDPFPTVLGSFKGEESNDDELD
jgi:hypothetical protein